MRATLSYLFSRVNIIFLAPFVAPLRKHLVTFQFNSVHVINMNIIPKQSFSFPVNSLSVSRNYMNIIPKQSFSFPTLISQASFISRIS